MPEPLIHLDPLTKLIAIHAWQNHRANHQGRLMVIQVSQGLFAAWPMARLISMRFQSKLQLQCLGGAIFNDQNFDLLVVHTVYLKSAFIDQLVEHNRDLING
jgi:hypothetical protein